MKDKTMINNDEQQCAALFETIKDGGGVIDNRKRNLYVYISLGAQVSPLEQEFPSSKLRGIEIARRFPQSKLLDPSHRTHCKWLYEALYKPGHPANDILEVLGAQSIYDVCVYTGHPTVIYRRYHKAKALAA